MWPWRLLPDRHVVEGRLRGLLHAWDHRMLLLYGRGSRTGVARIPHSHQTMVAHTEVAMDSKQFDDMLRLAARRGSRRAAIGTLVGGLLAALAPAAVSGKRKRGHNG